MKHATGYLTPEDYAKLKILAKDADKSMVRLITRVLEKFIREQWAQREEINHPDYRSPKEKKIDPL